MEQVQHTAMARLPWKWGLFVALGLLALGWLLNTPVGLLGKADAVGYAVCHRIEARSFSIDGRPMPLCVRCTGQYLGAVLGLAYQAVISRRRSGLPGRPAVVLLGGFFLAYTIDGLNSYLHLPPLLQAFPNLPRLYEPNHVLRLLTGTGMGLTIASALYPAFVGLVFRQSDPRPALPGRYWPVLLLLAAGIDGLVLLEVTILRYLFALVSAAGVVVLLTMAHTAVWLILLRLENRYNTLAQAFWPLVGGLGMALLQIAVFDLLRYALTHSWGGFPIG